MEYGEPDLTPESKSTSKLFSYEIEIDGEHAVAGLSHWRYSEREPDTLRVEFIQHRLPPEEWTFSRELLCAFLENDATEPVGVGDVRFVPNGRPHRIGLALSSDQGSILLAFPRTEVESFLDGTLEITPNTDAARMTAYEVALFLLERETGKWDEF